MYSFRHQSQAFLSIGERRRVLTAGGVRDELARVLQISAHGIYLILPSRSKLPATRFYLPHSNLSRICFKRFHGAGRPAASTLATNDSKWPGYTTLFVAMVPLAGLTAL